MKNQFQYKYNQLNYFQQFFMQESTKDFQAKLFAIKPFKKIQSPPSSHKKNRSHKKISFNPDFQFKFNFPQIQPSEFLLKLEEKKKAHSEKFVQIKEDNQEELNLMKSLSSTIDLLFSKIEKIKSEFDYPLLEKQIENQNTQEPKIDPVEIKENLFRNFRIQEKQNKKAAEKNKDVQYSRKQFVAKEQKTIDMKNALNQKYQISAQPIISPIVSPYSTIVSPISTIVSPISPIRYEYYYDKLEMSLKKDSFSSKLLRIQDFEIGGCIGSGGFGDVFLCKHKRTGFLCAMKKLLKSTIKEYRMMDQLVTELRINYRLNHANIIQLYGHFEDEYHIFLVMEYATDGVLMNHLKKEQDFVSPVISELLDAVQYMHKNSVVHRDIKPENIVLTMGVVKLCDFGWASIFENQMKKTFCGTLDYVSPEMKDKGQYGFGIDLWSIGVLTFQLLAGFPPHKNQINHWKLCGSKKSMKWKWNVIYPPQITDLAKAFIQNLLKEDPDQRFTIQKCKQTLFISKYQPIHPAFVQDADLVDLF